VRDLLERVDLVLSTDQEPPKGWSPRLFRVYSPHSLACLPVGDVPEPIRTTLEVARWAGVHVR